MLPCLPAWRALTRVMVTPAIAGACLGCQPQPAPSPEVLVPGTDYAFEVP